MICKVKVVARRERVDVVRVVARALRGEVVCHRITRSSVAPKILLALVCFNAHLNDEVYFRKDWIALMLVLCRKYLGDEEKSLG